MLDAAFLKSELDALRATEQELGQRLLQVKGAIAFAQAMLDKLSDDKATALKEKTP